MKWGAALNRRSWKSFFQLRKSLTAALLALFLGACATHPKVDPRVDWNSRIGSYSYEEAVNEIGKPDSVADSSEGRIADWILHRSPNISFGFGVGTGVGGPHVGTGVGVGPSVSPPPHGEYLRLVFDPQNRLKAWSHIRQ